MTTKTWIKRIVQGLVCLLIGFIIFWLTLPPLNPRSGDFWAFLIANVVLWLVVFGFSAVRKGFARVQKGRSTVLQPGDLAGLWKNGKKVTKVVILCIAGLLVLMLGVNIAGSTLLNADAYRNLITVEDGNFAEDVAELSMSQIPVVDRNTAVQLGKRKLGNMSDLVSQFEIAGDYTQINYHGTPVRVTPLAYADPIKWLNNHSAGIPAYITVDMVTQEATLVRLEQGMRYSPSEYFMHNIERYLRFQYPTKIFEDISFEIDEDGTPYWVAPTVSYRIAWWDGTDISGAVLVNAVTGESRYYDIQDIPSWVDQVYVSELVIEQLNYYGKFPQGFWNSVFGQKDVLQTTEGYNYLAEGDDVYLYTGMTSVLGDESNVGFVLVNLRTKQTKFYTVPGAEEYSAMNSAEGQVQHLNYTSTFPILLNISDRPTYFMSLKDSAGLVKMYAFVDVERYQVVGTGASVAAAQEAYMQRLAEEDVPVHGETTAETVSGPLEDIASAVVDGNTCYYFRISGKDQLFTVSIKAAPDMALAKVGDTVRVEYVENGGKCTVQSVTLEK